MNKTGQLEIKLTNPDEAEWMREVLHYGGEITRYMKRKGYLSERLTFEEWRAVQYEIYDREELLY